jgi:hypothetical protein
MLATYRGMEGFQGLYPATAREEACSPELCQCGETTLPLTRAELATTARTLSVITRLEPLAYTVLAAHRQALGLAANSYREGDDQGDADYVSAAVREASAQYAQSAELLGEGDKPADPLVFGSEPNHYSPPRHYQED